MTWLRNAWSWLVAALGGVTLVVALLWRRAVRQRNEARAERDAARASAERERQVRAEEEHVREVMRGKRVAIEAELEEVEANIDREREEIAARPHPTTRDEIVAELNRRMEARRGR